MAVIVQYDSGYDTRMVRSSKLEAAINEKGEPTFDPTRNLWVFPDGTTHLFKSPYQNERRRVVRLYTVPQTESDRQLAEILGRPGPGDRRRCHCCGRCY
jgi:hypothetical protein